MCAQVFPTWTPAYCLDEADLPEERGRASEPNKDSDNEEGKVVCVCECVRERTVSGMKDGRQREWETIGRKAK